MPVCKDKAAQPFLVGLQVTDIRDHQVNAQHVFLGKGGAAVDHDQITVALHSRNVLTDFIDSAQRNNF
ncbi:hypothetical protein SDC9_98805 [bioreactor metagenome]|uniref:Uncharacterized protein n=1 Tax=bioreactor metagenome TaxID=1076179 RepID=A0A645AFR3_9ZZZZ